MRKIGTRLSRQSDDLPSFFGGFLRSPSDVGSVVPSSAFLERRIVRFCELERVSTLVELGPGTGGTTRALLQAMRPDATLLCIELDAAFAERVRAIDDPRLIVHEGSAEHIEEALATHGLDAPDVVVSGIPFSTMPPPLAVGIVRSIEGALAPGGCFVAYQFRARVAQYADIVFGSAERSEPEVLNVPPMRLWRWRAAS